MRSARLISIRPAPAPRGNRSGSRPGSAASSPASFAIVRHPGFFLSLLRAAVRDLVALRLRRSSFERQVQRGDIVVSLGAGWAVPHYIEHIARRSGATGSGSRC